ncbi:hypothetical protein Trco_002850 [Trichoderma cornu-damae]|uniref:Uncharacterized protein n=1 Tax=Trichoderma cornu-damae TaxID=654480 RepID=A0A9P8TZI3_9HYPO|nr:hypothetical protein Trco_002850 [Trichoderma cornu-damae]
MVLFEHLPLFGLALSLAHHNNGRAPRDVAALLNHKPVPQISDGLSQFQQAAPKAIASRESDESREATIPVPQHHLQSILDGIQSLEAEIFRMMSSSADSPLDPTSAAAKYASRDPDDAGSSKAILVPARPERLVLTTRRGLETAPATAIIGGLFREAAPINLDASAASEGKSTTTVTSTTVLTLAVTMAPTGIATLTTLPTNLAKNGRRNLAEDHNLEGWPRLVVIGRRRGASEAAGNYAP